jgi:hypothetical protein
MIKLLTFITVLLVSVSSRAESIALVCEWKLFSPIQDIDTFMVDINKQNIYWVDENENIKIDEVNEGRITFKGVPKSRVINEYPPLFFVINRVTGELSVSGGKLNSSKQGSCKLRAKLL